LCFRRITELCCRIGASTKSLPRGGEGFHSHALINKRFAISISASLQASPRGEAGQRKLTDEGASYARIQVELIRCVPPHPSRYTLDTFSRLGEGFFSCAFVEFRKHIAVLTPIVAPDLRTQLTPRGTPILIGAGLAKPDQEGNIQGDGWRLRRSGHMNFPCHGSTQQCRLPVLLT